MVWLRSAAASCVVVPTLTRCWSQARYGIVLESNRITIVVIRQRRVGETYNRGRFRADEERKSTATLEWGQDRFARPLRKNCRGGNASASNAIEAPAIANNSK